MAQTDKARVFEVITRARQSGALADRETLMGVVSEVDLFKQFLDNYRASSAPAVAAGAAPLRQSGPLQRLCGRQHQGRCQVAWFILAV